VHPPLSGGRTASEFGAEHLGIPRRGTDLGRPRSPAFAYLAGFGGFDADVDDALRRILGDRDEDGEDEDA
jgi:hypothetical protein